MGLHVTRPYIMGSVTSASNIRNLSRSGTVGLFYSSKPYRLNRGLTSSTRQLISTVRSAILHTVVPRYTHLADCLYTWPTAPMTKVTLSKRVRYQARGLRLGFPRPSIHTNNTLQTISVITLARLFLDLGTMPTLSAYTIT